MTTKSELTKAKEKFEKEKDCLEDSKDTENIYKSIFKFGLVSLAYLGIRSFVGPEIDIPYEKINSLQFMDIVGLSSSYLCGLVGGLSYLVSYIARKDSEKDFNNAKSELEKLTENYKFERGHI